MTRLRDIYKRFSYHSGGGDKGTVHSYIELYEAYLNPNGSLLEIGVFKGHSLAMFAEYLRGDVVGLDIHTKQIQFDVTCLEVNATDEDAVREVLKGTTWTHIIDDGSHDLQDQLKSLKILWQYLEPDGKYFIEDITGNSSLHELVELAKTLGKVYIFDMRNVNGVCDDLMIMITKEGGVG